MRHVVALLVLAALIALWIALRLRAGGDGEVEDGSCAACGSRETCDDAAGEIGTSRD